MTEDAPDQQAAVQPVTTSEEPAADQPHRPKPGPGLASPTSRARRAAATSVEPGLRRPSPKPSQPAVEQVALTKSEPAAPTKSKLTKSKPTKSKPTKSKLTKSEPAAVLESEPAEVAAEPAQSGHRIRARAPLWLAAVLVLLIVALGGAAGWLSGTPKHAGSTSQRDQALSAAKSSVPLILTYNYKTFDADVAKAKAQLTGRANSDYVTAMTKTIKPAATKSDVVVQASTDSAGVETVSADGDQITVIVFGEQKVTNTSLKSPRIDMFRVRAIMNLVGGHWLVSKFDQI